MEKKIFEPIGDFNDVKNLMYIKESIEDGNKITDCNVDTSELEKKVEKKIDEYFSGYQEFLDYLSSLWGKYVNIKIYYKLEEEWVCSNNFNVLLTDFVYENDSLFGIYCMLDEPYYAFFQYTSYNIREILEKNRIEIQEITKEQFVKEAKENIDKCLQHRLDKINSDEYELTLNGYKHKKDKENEKE